MNLFTKILLLTSALSILCIPAAAEEEKKEGFGAAPFPVIAYTPETSLLFGGGSVFYLKPEDGGELRKTDSISIVAFYTLKNQFQAALSGNIYFFQDNLLIRANAAGSKFPGEFYGIGADTSKSAKEKYTPVYFPAGTSFLLRIFPALYAGIAYDSNYEKILSSSGGGTLDRRIITGSSPSFSSGVGTTAVYDTRDSEMNPHSGVYSEAKILFIGIASKVLILSQRAAWTSDHTFLSALLRSDCSCTAHQYGEMFLSITTLHSAAGMIPSEDFCMSVLLKDALSSPRQSTAFLYGRGWEWFSLWEREKLNQNIFLSGSICAAGGIGFRLMIDKNQKINMRMDLSYNGKESYGYVNIFEAF